MTRCVAFFRGINVGGNQAVRMDALKEMHEALDLKDVVTHIQSGNVVFSSDDEDTAQISKLIEEGFAQNFGFRVSVTTRTSAEIDAIINNNPLANMNAKEAKWVLVVFLVSEPVATAQEDLQKAYTGLEEFIVAGREVYIYYPDGMGRSKLTLPFMERRLKAVGTGRNWNTVLKLQQIMQRKQ